MGYERGRDTSGELVEVRTVLSRAETALKVLDRYAGVGHHVGWGPWDPKTRKSPRLELPLDQDIEAMREALSGCVAALDRWRRTGRSR